MWKTLSDWLLAFVNMARELQEHRTSIRGLETRLRDVEEAVKLLAQELRHARELEAAQREQFVLRLEREFAKLKEPPRSPRKKSK
jgi:archaellum component FlaC